MNQIVKAVMAAAVMMSAAAPCWAHGAYGEVSQGRGYCLTAMYDDGEPMSYAAVEITGPDSKIAFQTGRTDRSGCFMFRPDSPGAWTAVVQDGMGHRMALDVTVGAGEQTADPKPSNTNTPPPGTVNRPLAVAAGLSVIFGLFGIWFGWKSRRAAN